MLRISDDLLDFDENQTFYYNGKLFTGVSVEEHDGRLLSELNYKDGLQHGVARGWYITGELEGVSHFVEGSLHGRSQEWFRSGKLKRDALYEYGVLTREKKWDDDGNVIRDYQITEQSPTYSILQLRRKHRAED